MHTVLKLSIVDIITHGINIEKYLWLIWERHNQEGISDMLEGRGDKIWRAEGFGDSELEEHRHL